MSVVSASKEIILESASAFAVGGVYGIPVVG